MLLQLLQSAPVQLEHHFAPVLQSPLTWGLEQWSSVAKPKSNPKPEGAC
jgi:hypothetical protein